MCIRDSLWTDRKEPASPIQTETGVVHPCGIPHEAEKALSLIHISDFILSLCELIVGGKEGLQPVQKTIIDRCVRSVSYTHLDVYKRQPLHSADDSDTDPPPDRNG